MEINTNGDAIKALISLEETLYEKFREVQEKKNGMIMDMLAVGECRCTNCKSKITKVKNSFFINHECNICHQSTELEKKNRKDIYKKINGKWKRVKYQHNGWWWNKHLSH
tara:strand:+ start:686 stop:1015 length:330 start_codon:yes stop_codon:yes gene_type:complete